LCERRRGRRRELPFFSTLPLSRGSVHWIGYDTTALDIEVDPQCRRFGNRKSDFALQALVECRALEPK
jgi:hypothetical protein